MRKKFLINIAFLIGLNILIKPFWILGIDREVQNIVGNEAYGIYYAMFNFTFLFQILLDLGITNLNNQSIAQNHDFLKQHFSKLGGLKLGLALLYLMVTILLSLTMGYTEQATHLLYVLAINQFLLSFVLFLRSSISGLQIFWLDSIISVLDRVLLISICSVLIWGKVVNQEFQIEWLAYAQSAAYSFTLLMCLSIVILKARSFFSIPDTQFIRSTLKKSLPFAVIVFFMTMYFKADAVMIERLITDGEYQTGIYAQGYRFFDVLNNFVYLFTAILFPMLSKEMALGKPVEKLVTLVSRILSLSFIGIVGLAIFLPGEIIDLSYRDISTESSTVLTILLITFVPMVISSIYGTVITAGGKLKIMMLWSGISFMLNLILNLILIPTLGIVGAALASFVAQLTMAFSCYFLAGKKFQTFVPMSTLVEVLLPLVVTLGILFFIDQYLSAVSILGILIISTLIVATRFILNSFNEFKLLGKINSSK
ncbi:MAG: hypothetical protein CL840_07250 [Crocinitomicaceae bacterium]|nr:hypothetical protein [Crocinitomicaceae bacterium]